MALEYELILTAEHFPQLLESLRLHRVALDNAPSANRDREIMDDLIQRTELLQKVAEARQQLHTRQAAYDDFISSAPAAPAMNKAKPIRNPFQ